MQIDMHYYGTYALAKLAGFNDESAKVVATSAQFVDDCASKSQIQFQDAGQIDSQATAHHALDATNIDREDQRQVWVPFHFLPGGVGQDFTEKLVCRKDSGIAQEMFEAALGGLNSPCGEYRLGIAAHVYADTFSHYGFSGIGSRRNKVINNSFWFDGSLEPEIRDYITEKAKVFEGKYNSGLRVFCNFKSWLGESCSGALGHGAVATYPDRPYLVWGFDYEYPNVVSSGERNNPATFMEACRRLYGYFVKAVEIQPTLGGGHGCRFDDCEAAVSEVLAFQAKHEDRCAKWQDYARTGRFSVSFEIPNYEGMDWLESRRRLHMSDRSEQALGYPLYQYYRAASAHRQFVLRELLPKYGLIVA